MADSKSDIRDRVRTITDYDTQIINNQELGEVLDAAEDEIRSDRGEPSLTFYQGDDTFDIDLAVMWLSCLFAKIKTGEIEGPTISLGEVRAASLNGANAFWRKRMERALRRSGGLQGFGSTTVSRTDRTYGESF